MRVMPILLMLLLAFSPLSLAGGLTLIDDDSINQGQQQGQLQGQQQGQDQGQHQSILASGNSSSRSSSESGSLALQGQAQKNTGNQGNADVNISYEDQLQFPSHVGLQAAYGTDTAQMSIGGLTLSDTAPHVIAQTKMSILGIAYEAGVLSSDEVRAEVLTMLDQLNVQTRPKRIFGWGPRTSGKHLFNLFGIIATDSYRGNGPDEEPNDSKTIDEL